MMGSMLVYNLIFGLFIIIIIFISLDKATSGTIITDTEDELNTTNTSFSLSVKDTVTTLNTTWLWIPALALFGLIYMAISYSQGGV